MLMIFRRELFVAVLIAQAFICGFASGASGGEALAPVWEWKASAAGEAVFDGRRQISAPEVRSLYDPAKPFSVEVRLKPGAEMRRLAGIVCDYSSSKTGGWYLSLGAQEPFASPRIVVVEGEENYRSAEGARELVPGKVQTLLLIKDEELYRLWLDGELIANLPVEETMDIPSGTVFMIGKRAKDYFTGEIEAVRLWNSASPAPEGAAEKETAANHLSNGSFEEGEQIGDVLLWHRMTQSDVAPSQGWEIATDEAYEGKRSLRTTSGAPLVLMDEVWEKAPEANPWVFSVWMKADRDGVKCELQAGLYTQLTEQAVSETVVLTREWKQYKLSVSKTPSLHGRHSTVQGPVNFRISPEANATVWVDAAQWQEGYATKGWSAGGSGMSVLKGEATKPVFPAAEAVSRPLEGEGSWAGEIPLRVFSPSPASEEVRPVALGVPMQRGLWDGRGEVRLVDAEGRSLPVQTEIIARQGTEGGEAIRVLGVQFLDRLKAGWSDYRLEILKAAAPVAAAQPFRWRLQPPSRPGLLWNTIEDVEGKIVVRAGSLRAIGLDGTLYDSGWDPEAEWKVEEEGSVSRTIRTAGRLMDKEGRALLGYVARISTWRELPGVKLEVSVINTRGEGSVPVRTLFWQCESGPSGEVRIEGEEASREAGRFEKLTIYEPAGNQFRAAVTTPRGARALDGRAPQALEARSGDRSVVLQAPGAWQYHPSAIAWERGIWKGYLWPESGVRALLLPRGLALTREFWLREGEESTAAAWEQPPVAMAAPVWWQENDVLLPFAAADRQRHPFMDRVLGTESLLAQVNAAQVEREKGWGVFDHGDYHGDGGWSNLESYRDWAILLTALRTGDAGAFSLGLKAAKHYRDIDIDQNDGLCYVHNFNHISGEKDPSHAWPSGVAMHYLLTGSKRSKEVILLHGESILATPEEFLATRGLRSLGRWLLNLADVYLVSGDERYKERYFSQIEACRRELEKDRENPDRSIFSYIGNWSKRRLVPFHAWYGIAALQSMQNLTGDRRLETFISGEIAATLNPELYRRDIEELWPGVNFEEGMPLILADFARQRGSFAYPVLVTEATETGREDRARLALDALYAWAVEGRGVDRIEATLASTPLRTMKAAEEEMIAAAGERLWKGAAPSLLNGDFSLSDSRWTYWRPFPGKSLSYHTNWEERRRRMVALDGDVRKEGPRSLRYELMPKGFNAKIHVDTHRFRLEPGQHRFTGWLRWDAGAMPPVFGVDLRDRRGGIERLRVATAEDGIASITGNDAGARPVKAELSPPDGDGWRQFQLFLHVTERRVANLHIGTHLRKEAAAGHLWLDSIGLTHDSEPGVTAPASLPAGKLGKPESGQH